MKRKLLKVLAVAVLIAACAEPLPPERADYAGIWTAPGVTLSISREGMVEYEMKAGNLTKKINAPLQEFQGDSFSVGVGFMSTTFAVAAAPHQEGGAWRMTVDGRELTRK